VVVKQSDFVLCSSSYPMQAPGGTNQNRRPNAQHGPYYEMTDVKDSSAYAAATTPGDMSNFYEEVNIVLQLFSGQHVAGYQFTYIDCIDTRHAQEL